MNVLIFKDNTFFNYNMFEPIEDQIKGSTQIVVNYVEQDENVHHFLDEIERISQSSFGYGLNIKVIHNNLFNGAKAKKLMAEAQKNLSINDIIQMMALNHKHADDALSEIAQMCNGKNCDE